MRVCTRCCQWHTRAHAHTSSSVHAHTNTPAGDSMPRVARSSRGAWNVLHSGAQRSQDPGPWGCCAHRRRWHAHSHRLHQPACRATHARSTHKTARRQGANTCQQPRVTHTCPDAVADTGGLSVDVQQAAHAPRAKPIKPTTPRHATARAHATRHHTPARRAPALLADRALVHARRRVRSCRIHYTITRNPGARKTTRQPGARTGSPRRRARRPCAASRACRRRSRRRPGARSRARGSIWRAGTAAPRAAVK